MKKVIKYFNNLLSPNIIYGASISIERILSFLIVPILGRELSAELYAVWSQTAGIIIFITNILIISTPSAIIPFISSFNVKRQLIILSKIIVAITPIFFVFGIIAFNFDKTISYILWGDKSFYFLIIPIFFWICSEALFELFISILRIQEKFNLCSIFYTIKYLLRIIILYIFVEDNLETLTNIFWIIAFTQSIFLIPLIVIFYKYLSFLNLKKTKKIFSLGINISILGILSYFCNFADRFLIVHKLNLETLTPYVLAFSIGGCISIVYSAIGFTLFPRLSKFKTNNFFLSQHFETSLLTYIFIGCSGVTFLTSQGPNIIYVLTSYNFVISKIVFLFVSISIFLNGIQQLIQYFQVIKSTLLSTQIGVLVSGIICFFMNWFYLEDYGIEFAAITISLGSFLTILIIILLEKKKIPKIRKKILFKFIVFSVISAYLADLIEIDQKILTIIILKFLLQSTFLLTLDYLFGKDFLNIIFKKTYRNV